MDPKLLRVFEGASFFGVLVLFALGSKRNERVSVWLLHPQLWVSLRHGENEFMHALKWEYQKVLAGTSTKGQSQTFITLSSSKTRYSVLPKVRVPNQSQMQS